MIIDAAAKYINVTLIVKMFVITIALDKFK